MRKYMLIYLLLALPAILVALFYQNRTGLSAALQWVFAVLMLAGWGVTTGFAAYRHGRRALGLLLLYLAVAIFDISMVYALVYSAPTEPNPFWRFFFYDFLGLLTFRPFEVIIRLLLEYNIPHEFVVLGILAACCLIGFIVGIVLRLTRRPKQKPLLGRLSSR